MRYKSALRSDACSTRQSQVSRLRNLVYSLILGVWLSSASAQVYQITDLRTLPGQTTSTAIGINQSGQVAGNPGNHAFLYSNGNMTDLGFLPGSSVTEATGINNKGQIVGEYSHVPARSNAGIFLGITA
jgi:probable HAF family extracellular repeat protein